MPDHYDPDRSFLTARQRRILQFVWDFFQDNGYGPTLREIARAADLKSTSAVAYQIGQLKEKGYLNQDQRRPRTIVPTEHALPEVDSATDEPPTPPPSQLLTVPLVSEISAGYGTIPYESVEDTLVLPEQLVGHGELMAFRVTGESMVDAGIADQDLVIVRHQPDAANGEIVAAQIRNETSTDFETTVKTLKIIDGHRWLIPHNPAFAPFMADNAQIIGKVVTVLRRL